MNLDLSIVSKKKLAILKAWLIQENKPQKSFICLLYGAGKKHHFQFAQELAKQTDKEIMAINLSEIVSKYIGETEKNLTKLFKKVENKNWILFFDEADALFGKRTEITDSNDKYANQEVSYFLEKFSKYKGLILISSRYKLTLSPMLLKKLNLSIVIRKQ